MDRRLRREGTAQTRSWVAARRIGQPPLRRGFGDREVARALGFEFPIATDNDWTTLGAYGVGRVFRRFTSVSFPIDRGGVIRFVHDGGEFHRGGGPAHAACNAAFEALEAAVVDALEAAPQASSKPAIQPR